ncbi:putative 2-iminoacetate synthase [Streptomyces afghaniensis 772]|uniref:Putative 2-iminoacetate synthase n=1 Tax=Streptomyces afghaniensis 772 TaxID=1283301 RepID=S4MTH0_9ACTN|nr:MULTISPECIES: 3-methyl-2-indolic acid synthase [Streptomyces]EPJ36917.1 putative 2-iminoacetate synthase [Streptomyces afghaniensis 772]UOB10876.1 3-methyl-2-indolic acid synthase [Streptomyces sp. HP-A2021]
MTQSPEAVAGDFTLPELEDVRREAAKVDTHAVLALPESEEPAWSREAMALALWEDRSISTEELKAAAEARCAARTPRLHTFVPLYTTNYCDSECKMCSMRKGNLRLDRKFSGRKEITAQLEILYHHEGVRGVGFLTGEYEDKHTRLSSAFRIGWAIRTALDMGYERVYFNIGSMEPDEIDVLGEWIGHEEPVTMCVFQESYDKETYGRFMGQTSAQVPKANFDRRVVSFDRWLDAGFRYVNPGVLVGLHDDLSAEIVSLVSHGAHLRARGAVVDLSVPRMRPAMTSRDTTRVNDDDYLRMMSAVAFTCPEQRLVLTTREPQEFQDVAMGLAGVISPGSPDVAPYRPDSRARNDEASSQFLVADLRRPRHILSRIEAGGRPVEHFVDPSSSAPTAG